MTINTPVTNIVPRVLAAHYLHVTRQNFSLYSFYLINYIFRIHATSLRDPPVSQQIILILYFHATSTIYYYRAQVNNDFNVYKIFQCIFNNLFSRPSIYFQQLTAIIFPVSLGSSVGLCNNQLRLQRAHQKLLILFNNYQNPKCSNRIIPTYNLTSAHMQSTK